MMGKRFGIAVLVVILWVLCLDVGGGLWAPGEFGFVAPAEAVVGRPLTPSECRRRRPEDAEAVCRRCL